MFETVVVGADGSDTAAEAVRVATELVRLSNGNLHIVTAYKPQQLRSPAGEEFAQSISTVDLAESVLTELASRARTAGIAVETHLKSDAPADAICEVATQVKADVIVVGNKGTVDVPKGMFYAAERYIDSRKLPRRKCRTARIGAGQIRQTGVSFRT